MMQEINLWMIGGGLGIGLLFGAIVQRSRFCSLAAMGNWVVMRDLRQVHGYLAAVAVAAMGTALLEFTGLVPVAESYYRAANINWLGALAGGAVFGFGMVLSGGCIGRLLVRGAEGSTSALFAIGAAAIGAAASAYGVLAPARTALAEATAVAVASGDASLTGMLGLPTWIAPVVVVIVCALVIVPSMRRHASGGLVLAGALIGVLVAAGWFVTGYLARDEFDVTGQRPVSMAFASPLAQSLHFFTSGELVGNLFQIALVIGVIGGAYASAAARGGFRWTIPSGREIARVSLGGGFMGVGAVFAGGCNIGQGLTGLSTCSLFALLAVIGIMIGLRLGLAWLLREEKVKVDESVCGDFRSSDESGSCVASGKMNSPAV